MERAKHSSGRQAHGPGEVVAPPADTDAYEEWRVTDHLRGPYRLPHDLLKGIRTDAVSPAFECPLIIFINARSGGRIGARLATTLSRSVGRVQVYDTGVPEYRPDKVLSRLWETLKQAEAVGDIRARTIRQRLRILVCGGDGTIAWVMGVIKKLRLHPEPPIAIMPLGTGNDLSRTFRWGPAFEHSWIKGHTAMYNTLNKVAIASVDELDCWRITITMPRKELLREYPHCLAPPAAPGPASASMTHPIRPSSAIGRGASSGLNATPGGQGQSSSLQSAMLHPVVAAVRDSVRDGSAVASVASFAATAGSQPAQNIATSSVGSAVTAFTTATNVSVHTTAAVAGTPVQALSAGPTSTSAEDGEGIGILGGMFWNYFSVGLDAKAAWGFHSLREEHPGCTNSRAANQFWYSFFSCTTGWFCCAQPLNVKVKLEILKPGAVGAGWQTVPLPSNVKALVVLNLQSYAGGRNLWGRQDSKEAAYRMPSYNDGMLEVVGLGTGWHTGLVMASKGDLVHGKRLCQAAGIRLALQAPYVRADGEPSHCYMQIDGEPWRQDIGSTGSDERPVMVEIVHAGTSKLLRNNTPAETPCWPAGSARLKPGSARNFGQPALVTATQEALGSSHLGAPAQPGTPQAPSSTSTQQQQPPSAGGLMHFAQLFGQQPTQPQQPLQQHASSSTLTGAAVGPSGHQGPVQGQVQGGSAVSWARPASSGRPSVASAGGSGAGPSRQARGGTSASVAGDGGDGGVPTDAAPSSPLMSHTPRTSSIELSSHGGRSVVQEG